MYVHRGARLVYLAHPRTASVATAAMLQVVGFEHDPTVSHHAPLDGRESTFTEERASWHVFTTVRNHYDTCVSWAFNGPNAKTVAKTGLTVNILERALDNGWVHDHELWWPHGPHVDQVLRYETLQSDLAQLLHANRLYVPTLQRRNVTELRRNASYRDFYTTETQAYVAERFKDELLEYGYSYDTGGAGAG